MEKNIEAKRSIRKDSLNFISEHRTIAMVGLIAVFIIVFGSIFSKSFLTFDNFSSVLLNMSLETMIVIAMTILLISGEFDLSLGSTMVLAGILCGLFIKSGVAIAVAMLIGFIVSLISGVINGFLVSNVGVNSFIATLATGMVYKGIAIRLAGPGFTDFPVSYNAIGQKIFLGLQLPVWYMIILAVIFSYFMSRTRFFRQYYYVGGNIKAAALSGINIQKVKIIGFTIAAGLSGLAGMVSASRYGSAMVGVGTGVELRAITASVIGGVSIGGGVGTMFGAIIGALFIALVKNGLIIANVDAYWQQIVEGIILVLAVTLDVTLTKKRI